MQRMFLSAKIRDIRITALRPDYEGSILLDEEYMEKAGILPFEEVHVLNLNAGTRIITYAIKGERGSGLISVNGSAARRASVGDLLIIASFAQVAEADIAKHAPQLVFVDEKNQQVGLRHHVPTQAAPGHGTDEC